LTYNQWKKGFVVIYYERERARAKLVFGKTRTKPTFFTAPKLLVLHYFYFFIIGGQLSEMTDNSKKQKKSK